MAEEKYFETGSVYGTRRWSVGMRSTLAWELLKHWSIVAAKPDGEDTAGRQKLAMQTHEELIEKAFAVARSYVDRMEKDGEVQLIEKGKN